MSTQANFVCWSADTVTATIPTEAATPSDAVLLATHAPLRITRRGGKGGDAAKEIITEHEVLEEFLTAEPNNGVLVATVKGESGAGKSHLVRWANANIDRTTGRHVIYLQKTETSLKDVVEALLVDQHDTVFDEIRRRVSTLGSGITVEEMEQRILNEMAEALRTHEAQTPLGKALVGDNGLALFFLDPLFRQHLLREGSFVKRRAQHALHGRDADEPDIPLEFTVDELPLDIGEFASILEAAAATQKIFRRLSSNAQLQAEAVALLNELLDVAVTKAASLGVGDVGQAFKKIREKFVGQEIVLLIEDVALIQGVRRDLLDAIVEVGVVQGEERYATVRTMMAVTGGYYIDSLPETFKRRAEASSPLYEVDVDLDSGTADEQDMIDFVGRYLNAARVGKDALETATPQVPNHCASCPFQAPCHEDFGASSGGYGLYPYNRPAIVQAVRACGERDGTRLNFNPRKVLSRAVRDVLNDNVDVIRDGLFPPAVFLAVEAKKVGVQHLPLSVRERIEEQYPKDESGRLTTLLNFWGDGGRKEIPTGILTAFSHEPIPADLFDQRPNDRPTVEGGAPPVPGDTIPPSVHKQVEAINNWSTGHTLPQGLANEMRSVLREAILARITWFDPVIKEPDSGTLKKVIPTNAGGISIVGASENIQNANPVLVVPRTARMANMFCGLVLLRAGFPERAGEALPRLDALAESAVAETRKRVVAELAIGDASLVDAAASLLRGAAACGHLPPKAKELYLVNAVLWSGSGHQRSDVGARAQQWMDAYTAYVAERAAVVDRFLAGVGAAQGNGVVHAVDIHRLLPIVRKAKARAEADGQLVIPSWCEVADRKLKALERVGAAQLEHWQKLTNRIRAHLPEGVGYSETVGAVIDAATAGHAYGLVKVNDLAALVARNDAAKSWDAAGVAAVEKLLANTGRTTGLAQVMLVGTEVGADLAAIADYLDATAAWIDAGLREAESDGGVVTDLDAEIQATIREWFGIVAELEPSKARPATGTTVDASEDLREDSIDA